MSPAGAQNQGMTKRPRVFCIAIGGMILLLGSALESHTCARCGTSATRISVLGLGGEVPGLCRNSFPALERVIGPCGHHAWFAGEQVAWWGSVFRGCGINGQRVHSYRTLEYVAQQNPSQAQVFYQHLREATKKSQIIVVDQEMLEWIEVHYDWKE
jgi:hypothetical protein